MALLRSAICGCSIQKPVLAHVPVVAGVVKDRIPPYTLFPVRQNIKVTVRPFICAKVQQLAYGWRSVTSLLYRIQAVGSLHYC